jgi:hypothetical protein
MRKRKQKRKIKKEKITKQMSEVSRQRSDSAEKFIEFVVGADPDPFNNIALAMADCADV